MIPKTCHFVFLFVLGLFIVFYVKLLQRVSFSKAMSSSVLHASSYLMPLLYGLRKIL